MSDEVMTDEEVLRRQYEDDRNLRARQRLWDISPSEPQLNFNQWSVELLDACEGDSVLDAGCGNGRALALLQQRVVPQSELTDRSEWFGPRITDWVQSPMSSGCRSPMVSSTQPQRS